MKSRETEYDGRLFRSRLEAKWAAFFVAWGLPYDYEPERYGPGRKGYLPDFHLPTLNLFVEVKPACKFLRDDDDVCRAKRAAKYMPGDLWIAYGEPIAWGYVMESAKAEEYYPLRILAHCRRCHGLTFLLVFGKTIEDCWHDAENGGCGWGEIGKHTCGDQDRRPIPCRDDALSAAYINGRKQWFLF